MKTLHKIWLYIIYLFTFQFIDDYKMNQLAKKTNKIAIDLSSKRAMLKSKINHYVKLHYGVAANSEFIPASGVNKARLHKDIYHKFGNKMKAHSLTLTKNLRWK